MQAHDEKVHGRLEKSSSKDEDKVGSVSVLKRSRVEISKASPRRRGTEGERRKGRTMERTSAS